MPGPVSSLGHVVPLGGAAASPSILNDALGLAQHHCREAAEGAPHDRAATGHLPTHFVRLSNAQVKKLSAPERAKYRARLQAALEAQSKVDATDGAGEHAPVTRGAMPHSEREEHATPATAGAFSTGSRDGVSARTGQQVTSTGSPGQTRADLGRD